MLTDQATTEAEFDDALKQTRTLAEYLKQRPFALKHWRHYRHFKASAAPQVTVEPGRYTTAPRPTPDPPAAVMATTEQAWAWLKRQWDDGAIVGIARLHDVLDSEQERTTRGALQWGNVKALQFTVGHSGQPIADVLGVLDVPNDALPWRIQGSYAGCTGAVLVARRYHDTPAGQAAKAAVLSGQRTGMSYTFRPERKESTWEGGARIDTVLQASLSEFCDSDRAAQHPTLAHITADLYMTPRGVYLWDL